MAATHGGEMVAAMLASAVVDGLGKRKRLVLPGATVRAAYWTWRVAPTLNERLMRSRVK